MDSEQVRSCMFLRAVPPLLEEVVMHDTAVSEIIKNWNCAVMMHVGGGGPAVTLKFAGGRREAVRDKGVRADRGSALKHTDEAFKIVKSEFGSWRNLFSNLNN